MQKVIQCIFFFNYNWLFFSLWPPGGIGPADSFFVKRLEPSPVRLQFQIFKLNICFVFSKSKLIKCVQSFLYIRLYMYNSASISELDTTTVLLFENKVLQ